MQLYAYFVDCMNAYVFTEQRRQQQQQLQDKTTTPSYTLITLPGWYTQWEKSRFTHETTKSARSSNDASQPPLIDPSIAPMRLFVGDTGYQSFDPVTGLPLTTADGQPVTKSALKKLHKQLDAHTKRHEKWQRSVAVGAEARSSTCNARTSVTDDAEPTTATAEASAATSAALKNSPEQSFADVLSVHSKDAPDSSKNEDTHGVGPFKDINWDEEIDPSFCRVVSGTFGKRQGLEFHSDMGPFCHFVRL